MNQRFVLAKRPIGGAIDDGTFNLDDALMPELADGQVLVRTLYLSLDPYMRGRLSLAKSYAPPLQIGDVMVGEVVGEVVESRNSDFSAGDIVLAQSGWQQYAALTGDNVERIPETDMPISYYLGVLGMPGATAYFALKEIGRPRPGETAVISAAAGAVGQVAGQLAKHAGCRVIGVAGADDKVAYLRDELKFDAALTYKGKDAGRLTEEIYAAAPNGVDVFFDNVGGLTHDAAMRNLAPFGRVIICGVLAAKPEQDDIGIRWNRQLLIKRALIQGFLVNDYRKRWPEFRQAMTGLLKTGKIVYREDIMNGIESAPRGLIGLLQGVNRGKLLVRVASREGGES